MASLYDKWIAEARCLPTSSVSKVSKPYSDAEFDGIEVADLWPEDKTTWTTIKDDFLNELSQQNPSTTFLQTALYVTLELRDPEDTSRRAFTEFSSFKKPPVPMVLNTNKAPKAGTVNGALVKALRELTEDQQQVLIPVIAAVMVRMTEKTAKATQAKLESIAKNMASIYPSVSVTVPLFSLANWMGPLEQAKLSDILKHSYWKRAVMVKMSPHSGSGLKGLMEWLILQSLTYTGLPLISTVQLVCDTYPIPLQKLMEITGSGLASTSWGRLMEFLTKHKPHLKDEKWIYIRAFKDDVMAEYSYNKNSYLVGILLYLAQLKTNSSYYTNYTQSFKRAQLPADDIQLAERIHLYIQNMISTEGATDVFKTILGGTNAPSQSKFSTILSKHKKSSV